ncbi:MAG TPA: class I adenylate-forming enzyme family protein [Burkholderiales bacterium]|nr:class I adenylate-forming enzyme family protein [Burkholderiales bacterium]
MYRNLGTIGIEYRGEDRPAIVDLCVGDAPREVSWRGYNESCDAVARGVLKRGLKPGERVGIVSGNRAEFLEVFYGAMRAGVVPVLINILQPKETIDWVCRNSDVKLLFAEKALSALCPGALPRVVFEEDYEQLKDPGPFTPFEPGHDDIAFHAYTSGSTGRPKGVLLSHRAHSWVAQTMSRDRDFGPADRMVIAAAIYHKHGMNSVKCVLVGGSTMILLRRFEARKYLETATRYKATVVSGVPTMFALMLQNRDIMDANDYSCVRLATLGGAPASDVLVDEVTKRFPKARIIQIFGITEASAALFGKHPGGKAKPRHSLGWPLPGNELRLVGGESADFGVLEVRNPGLMSGYVNDPEQTAKKMKDGWYHSGDILRRDREGWYYFVGRADDMFVSSGHNIYPQDVEIMLERHADIEQACVVPVPDEVKHTLPVAFVVKRKGCALTEEEVKQYALQNAPPYQHPRQVHFLDALPVNTVGKIDRRRLEGEAKKLRQPA